MKTLMTLTMSVVSAMMVSVNILSSQQPPDADDVKAIEAPTESGFGTQKPFGQGPGLGLHQPPYDGPGIGPKAMMKKQFLKQGDVGIELEKKVMDIVSKNDPAFAKKLTELKKTDPNKYRQVIKLSLNLFEFADEGDVSDKDIVRGIALEFETRELAFKYNKANSSERDKIKSEIKSKLNELFDIRTKIQELRVKKLETRIKDLKQDIEKRKQNKTKIVEDRLNDLIGDKALKW